MFMKKDNEKYLSFELLDETFEFIKSLPFELTASQKEVLNEIFLDLKSKKQMNRLIQRRCWMRKNCYCTDCFF